MNEQQFFLQEGYLIVRNLLDTKELHSYSMSRALSGKWKPDLNCPDSYTKFKDLKMEQVLKNVLPQIEKYTVSKLYKSYSYCRVYKKGNVLTPHKDPKNSQIVISLSLGYEAAPWPIFVMDNNGVAQKIILHPGDALIMKGSELLHWREINDVGLCSQLMLHYVEKKGPYSNYKNYSLKKKYKLDLLEAERSDTVDKG